MERSWNRSLSAILAAGLALSLGAAGSTGCTRKKFGAPRISAAAFLDINNNGLVDDGDIVTVTFTKAVVVNDPSPASFVLPVAGDTLGSAATVGQFSPDTPQIEITLAGGPVLTIPQIFSPTLTPPGSPSGINIGPAMPADAIELSSGRDVRPAGQALDIGGNIQNPVYMTAAAFTDSGTVRGIVDDGDTIVLTFDAPVTVNAADPGVVFWSPVAGDTFGGDSTFPGPTTGVVNLVITLGTQASFTPNGVFDIASLQPGDPSGIGVIPGIPGGTLVHAISGVNVSPNAVPLELQGMLQPPPAPLMQSIDYQDTNTNRTVDANDLLQITFDRSVAITSTQLGGFALPVTGDAFGAGALLQQSTPGTTVVEILIGTAPTLTVNGIFLATQTSAGSPSGLTLLPANDIVDLGTGNPALGVGPLEIRGALSPFIVTATYVDANDDGQIGIDDELRLDFNVNVRLLASSVPVDQVLFFQRIGDTFGFGARWRGVTFDTPTLTARLGLGAVLDPRGLFDPLNPLAGPSGVDLIPASGNVVDMDGAVAAEPRALPGLDVQGVIGPKVRAVHYSDTNESQTVDNADELTFFFTAQVDINGNTPGQVFDLLVTGDTFGNGAAFVGGPAPQGVTSVVVGLGANPVLQPTGWFRTASVNPGDPTGIDFLPAAPVVDTNSGDVAIQRTSVGADLRGSLPGLVGPGPWRPTGNGLSFARFSHTATLLQDGKILVAGGGDLGGTLDRMEVFDPSGGAPGQGQFSGVPVTLIERRELHTATRIAGPDRQLDTPDDVVVIIGGTDFTPPVPVGHGSIEIVDPDANDDGTTGDYTVTQFPVIDDFSQFTIGPNQDPGNIFTHEAAYLPGANVQDPSDASYQDRLGRQIFTTGGRAWTTVSANPAWVTGFELGIVTLDRNGDGDYFDSDVILYGIQPGGNRMGKYTRNDHTMTVIPGADGFLGTGDDEIFVYGGVGFDRDDPGLTFRTLGSGEVLHGLGSFMAPDFTAVTQNDFYPGSPQTTGSVAGVDPTPRTDHVATLLSDGSVLIGHGTNEDGTIPFSPGNSLTTAHEVFRPDYGSRDLGTFTFNAITPVPPTGTVANSRTQAAAALFPGGRVLVAGGLDFLNSADPVNPDATDTSEEVFPFAGPADVISANGMATPRWLFPLTSHPGVDFLFGTADDRAIAIGGATDGGLTPTGTADFFYP